MEGSRQVRIRLQNNKEVVCSENDLEEIPLTESVLQCCYKSKTYVRDGKWDILWYLGGKKDVTIGEKEGKFYLIPTQTVEKVTDTLPFELVQGEHIAGSLHPIPIRTMDDLGEVYSDIKVIISYLEKTIGHISQCLRK